jgi:Flp pilus assembly protein TadD
VPTEAISSVARDPSDGTADTVAAFELGAALMQAGDLSGAEAAYRGANKQGHAPSATNLGVLLEQRGDLAGAEAAYRRADEHGDADGATIWADYSSSVAT